MGHSAIVCMVMFVFAATAMAEEENCPGGWTKVGHICYIDGQIPFTVKEAEPYCKVKDGRAGLPWFATLQEYVDFSKHADIKFPGPDPVLLSGISDIDNDGVYEVTTEDGKSCQAPFVVWQQSAASDKAHSGGCVGLWTTRDQMNTYDCNAKHLSFYCQIRLKPYTC